MSQTTPNEQLIIDLVLTVFRVNGTLLTCGDKISDNFQLTSARWQLLGAIALAEHPLTAPQIGGSMGISRQGVQKQLKYLLKEEFLTIIANPQKERSPLYTLTAKGQKAYDELMALNQQWIQALLPHFSVEALYCTVQTLKQLENQLNVTLPIQKEPF